MSAVIRIEACPSRFWMTIEANRQEAPDPLPRGPDPKVAATKSQASSSQRGVVPDKDDGLRLARLTGDPKKFGGDALGHVSLITVLVCA